VAWLVVQPSWQDVLLELPTRLLVPPTLLEKPVAPYAPGTTQPFWQSDAAELHLIMQLVTVDVTVDVSGVTGVNGCACAKAALRPASQIPHVKLPTPRTIAQRRMMASNLHPPAKRAQAASYRSADDMEKIAGARGAQSVTSCGAAASFWCAAAAGRTEAASRRQDVIVHRRRITFHLVQAMFDDVADRDDADRPALIHHREMTEFAFGHALHDARDRLGFRTGRDFPRHGLADGLTERGRTALRERTHDIALRQNADDAAVGAEYQHRTDALFGEQRHGGRKTYIRLYINDLAALACEDGAHSHFSLPAWPRGAEPACSAAADCGLAFTAAVRHADWPQ
jgi:hypothetical protein